MVLCILKHILSHLGCCLRIIFIISYKFISFLLNLGQVEWLVLIITNMRNCLFFRIDGYDDLDEDDKKSLKAAFPPNKRSSIIKFLCWKGYFSAFVLFFGHFSKKRKPDSSESEIPKKAAKVEDDREKPKKKSLQVLFSTYLFLILSVFKNIIFSCFLETGWKSVDSPKVFRR